MLFLHRQEVLIVRIAVRVVARWKSWILEALVAGSLDVLVGAVCGAYHVGGRVLGLVLPLGLLAWPLRGLRLRSSPPPAAAG